MPATNEVKVCVAIKSIIIGILKAVCLYNGYYDSDLHSGLTLFSLLFEMHALCNTCDGEGISKHDEYKDFAVYNIIGVFLKGISTIVTYYKEIEEIKKMCYLCLVLEIILIALLACCCQACSDDTTQESSKSKLSA